MSTFAPLFDEFLGEFLEQDPVLATLLGDHTHDGRWPDLSDAGRHARLTFARRWTSRFSALADADLESADAVDRDLVLAELAAMEFEDGTLHELSWSPLGWIYLLGNGLFPLLAREYAPLAVRLQRVAERASGIPLVVQQARVVLVGGPDRPVARLHTETALEQLPGVVSLLDDALSTAEVAGDADPEVAAILGPLRAATGEARLALNDFRTHLSEAVLPRSQGEGRLGPELFDQKLRHVLKSGLGRQEIVGHARREFDLVRAEMIRLARELWPSWLPGRPLPDEHSAGSRAAADQATVREVLDAIGAQHQPPEALIDFCRTELAGIEEFCRRRDLIGLTAEPLDIIWTPAYMRAFGGALLDPPGPLARDEKAFFAITPIPDDWTPAQVESYLREDNDRMLRLLTIHEAVPGHYLQLTYSNRSRSLARSIFASGVFAEGWAVYVTQVMMDLGYGSEDPALLLVHWKFYLRAVINALIDAGIHTAGMSEDEAVELMVSGGFQEESEARNKWKRARLSSTQLSTYFVGSAEMWEVELEARRRAAIAAGDPRGAAAVPAPRVVGNIGPTPGFDYRGHLEGVISHGSPPIPLLRRILFAAEA